MWQQNCRNLHVPLGTWEDNSKKIADITEYYCSRIRKMSEPAATPDHQEKWAHGTTSQDQGPDSSSQKDTKKKVSKGITAEGGKEVKIQNKELVGGHQGHESTGGEAAEEIEEEVGGVEAVPHPHPPFYKVVKNVTEKAIKIKIVANDVIFNNSEARGNLINERPTVKYTDDANNYSEDTRGPISGRIPIIGSLVIIP